MKNTILIVLAFISASCNNREIEIEKLIFNTRKYINKKADIYDHYNLDLSIISLDSVKEFPKYVYLESELDLLNRSRKNLLTSTNHNSRVLRKAIEITESRIDSINKIYDKTAKNEIYYKCYTSIPYMESNNEKEYNLNLIANESFEIIDYFYEFESLELE